MKKEDLGFVTEPNLKGPEIFDVDGTLAASLKYAVWLDEDHEYRTYLVELQNGKNSNKYDEIELYHIERVGEDRWETLNFRIHQSWNNINLVAINTRLNTNGEVPKRELELKHGSEWNPGEFYNS